MVLGAPECPEQLKLLLEYGLDGFHPNTLSLLAASLQQVVLVPGIDGPVTHREPARVVVLFLHHRETVDCVWEGGGGRGVVGVCSKDLIQWSIAQYSVV